MKRQTIIAVGVAVIIGLVAVFLANTYLTGRERQLASSPEGMVRVAVAAMPLAYGADVTADKVKFVNYPATSLPAGTYKSLVELLPQGKRRVALRPIQINQPLLAADLSGEGQNASIAALLRDGMRAATVSINDVSGVGGFVKPNDTVDVLVTRQSVGTDRGEQVTDVLLQNIRVLAMDQDAAGADGKPVVSRTATMEVTPIDAQKLALGMQVGSLSLVLRKPGEEQNVAQVDTVSLDDLRYSYYGGQPPPMQAAATGATGATVLSEAERRARIARLSQPTRRASVPRPVVRTPAKPATNTVDVTRGTTTSSYEVGGYDR
ncbi:Flp pilus assembly protein CpaB [Sphingomonas sp. LY160]|uniref:Flp pilus assembly protein CpaB n=1 Tax=Sphingomonas sp. LY160 TaxID=3095342 RepID=UPI002ADEE2C8|nr:Flp pilus assembly protein CpaB [Sphingomonas sp. LY160]MEA1072506.1 Flp pilus assembly protein CpaB [Sphingomonas sp. LY160]